MKAAGNYVILGKKRNEINKLKGEKKEVRKRFEKSLPWMAAAALQASSDVALLSTEVSEAAGGSSKEFVSVREA